MVNTGLLIEIVVVYALTVRFLHFWVNSLDEALENGRKTLQRVIVDKQRSCDELSGFLKTKNGSSTVSEAFEIREPGVRAVVNAMFTCREEVSELRTFAWSVGRYNVWSYMSSSNAQVQYYATDILRTSTVPKLIHRCEYTVCVDWSGIFDFSVISSIVASQLPGSTNFHGETVLVLSGLVALIYGIGLHRSRSLLRSLAYAFFNSATFIIPLVAQCIVSPALWVLRTGTFVVFYLSSFVVFPEDSELPLSVRLMLYVYSKPHQEVGLWCLLIFSLIGLVASVISRAPVEINNDLKLEKLSKVNEAVAQAWIEGDTRNLGRLRSGTLIDICKAADFRMLGKDRCREIKDVLNRDPLIQALFRNRRSIIDSRVPHSPLTESAISVQACMYKLGAQESQALKTGILGLFIVICVTVF